MNDELKKRRLIAVPIHYDFLIHIMKQQFFHERTVCIKGLPQDAICIGSFTDEYSQSGYLIFQHESFDVVPLGNYLPRVDIHFMSIRPRRRRMSELKRRWRAVRTMNDE